MQHVWLLVLLCMPSNVCCPAALNVQVICSQLCLVVRARLGPSVLVELSSVTGAVGIHLCSPCRCTASGAAGGKLMCIIAFLRCEQ